MGYLIIFNAAVATTTAAAARHSSSAPACHTALASFNHPIRITGGNITSMITM